MDNNPPQPSLRARPPKMPAPENGGRPSPHHPSTQAPPPRRNSPYLPTPTERLLVALYPSLLLLGAAFAALSPETRAAAPAATTGTGTASFSQDPALAPSYFARKDNAVNVLFVKWGWAWISAAGGAGAGTPRGGVGWGVLVRWAGVTGWWVGVTRWFFGPGFIDRGFRLSGGRCEVVELRVAEGVATGAEMVSAAACKAVGGRWSGGHDISGHVFMLVLGSGFLMQEVGWAVWRWREGRRGARSTEERTVVMADGSVRGAGVEARAAAGGLPGGGAGSEGDLLGLGGKFVLAVVALSLWMILMTAIYFHTWSEKVSATLRAGGSLLLGLTLLTKPTTTAYGTSRCSHGLV